MPVKLLLDSNKVLHKVFEGTKPGYDALQVDSFLDLVIKDYEAFSAYSSEAEKKMEDLQAKVSMLNEQLSQAEAENANYKAKLGDVANNQNTSMANLEYLKRISSLERTLKKLGVDPNMIK